MNWVVNNGKSINGSVERQLSPPLNLKRVQIFLNNFVIYLDATTICIVFITNRLLR